MGTLFTVHDADGFLTIVPYTPGLTHLTLEEYRAGVAAIFDHPGDRITEEDWDDSQASYQEAWARREQGGTDQAGTAGSTAG